MVISALRIEYLVGFTIMEGILMNVSKTVLLVSLVLVMVLSGCDEADSLGNLVTEATTTQDTVTITFSEAITSVSMPNSIILGGSTYYFAVKDTAGNRVDLGLLNQTENSITLVVLGKSSSTISGTYSIEVSTDVAGSVLRASKDISFQSWSGSNWYIDVFGPGSDQFMVQVLNNNTDSPSTGDLISGLVANDFSVFDSYGNRISFSYSVYMDYEFNLNFSTTLSNGNYWVRIARTGYNPSYQLVTLTSE